MKFLEFVQTKDGMVKPTCEQFQKWKDAGKPVKIVRCDSGGENIKLEKELNGEKWKLGVKFEHTARDTPQQNSIVEKGFDTLYCRGRAMMSLAKMPLKLRYVFFQRSVQMCNATRWIDDNRNKWENSHKI